jgi:hypothetical protein
MYCCILVSLFAPELKVVTNAVGKIRAVFIIERGV